MRGALCLFVLLKLGMGCAPTPEPELFGRHISIAFEGESEEICAGTIAYLDRFIVDAFELLEEPVPENFVVPVRVVERMPRGCPKRGGCFHRRTRAVYLPTLGDQVAFQPLGALRHELIHAIVFEVLGKSMPFFEEGLAESLGRSQPDGNGIGEATEVHNMLKQRPLAVDSYVPSARFTRFLIDSHGIAKFKQIYRVGARRRTAASFARKFREIYGIDLAVLEEQFLAEGTYCTFQIDICDLNGAESIWPRLVDSYVASCDDPDHTGIWGSVTRWYRTIQIEHDARYRLRASHPIRLTRCGACAEQGAQDVGAEQGVDVVVDLQSGIYSLIVLSDPGEIAIVDLEIMLDAPVDLAGVVD